MLDSHKGQMLTSMHAKFQATLQQMLKDEYHQLLIKALASLGKQVECNLDDSFLKLSAGLAELDVDDSTSTIQDAIVTAAKKLPTLTKVVKMFSEEDAASTMHFIPLVLVMTYEVRN